MSHAESPLASLSMCGNPLLDEPIRQFLSRLTRDLLDVCGDSLCLFLSGSASLGELTALPGKEIQVCSDIDMGIVFEDEGSKESARERLRAALPFRAPEGIRLVGGCELGFYSEQDLRGQQPKMGTLDMRAHAVALAGDRGVLDLIPPYDASAIELKECLYLLFNRSMAFLESGLRRDPEIRSRELEYLWVKLLLDVPTITLAALGRYRSRHIERVRLFKELLAREPALAEAAGMRPVLLAELEAALLYKRGLMDGAKLCPALSCGGTEVRTLTALLWEWLLRRGGVSVRGDSPRDLAQASFAFEPLRLRVRGWRAFLRTRRTPAQVLRGMGLLVRGSPLHVLLVCGAYFVVAGGSLGESWREFLEANLPFDLPGEVREGTPAEYTSLLVERWHELGGADVVRIF